MVRITWRNLKLFLRNPNSALSLLDHIGIRLNQRLNSTPPPSAVRVMREDWDNLIILDACRYDTFEGQSKVDSGTLEKRTSLGSDSWGFLQRNFAGEYFHDTVYISANPFTQTIQEETFHAVHNLLNSEWDEELGTVPPSTMVEEVIKLAGDYPNKRYIIHFMQPHTPFIGELGQRIGHNGLVEFDENQNPMREPEDIGIWGKLRFGISEVTIDEVYNAYRENLELVLQEVNHLLGRINGKTVITSDHGNLFGETTSPLPARGYGHPRDLFVPELVDVPWYKIGADRRKIVQDTPKRQEAIDDEIISDRLEKLGYR